MSELFDLEFYQQLAEAVLAMSEEELRQSEPDFESQAQRGRAILRSAVMGHRKKMRDAYSAKSLDRTPIKGVWMPARAKQRSFLKKVIEKNPKIGFTLQHRQFRELTDDDVEKLLRKLAELGVDLQALQDEDDGHRSAE